MLNISFLFVCFVCIVALRCRTAYIGLSVELLIVIVAFLKKHNIDVLKSYRLPLVFIISLIITVAGLRLYDMKRDSADGRILIWSISSDMIYKNPCGYGYGLFEKYYNLHQAEYFADGSGNEKERQLADFIFMPYNDFLEHGVEGGVIGIIFLVIFYGSNIIRAKRNKNVVCVSVFSAFALMSLTNFIYSSIQPWLLLMVFTSISISDKSIAEENTLKLRMFSCVMIVGLLLVYTQIVVRMTISQLKLFEYKERIMKGDSVSEDEFASIENDIATSEAYWTLRGYNNLLNERYTKAIDEILISLNYTSSPQSMELIYQAYHLSGCDELGIRHIEILRNIVPNLLRPKLILMQHYDRHGNIGKAIGNAREIIATKGKVENEKAERIRSIAYNYIMSHQ